MKVTISSIQFTKGLVGYGFQERDEDGDLVALYDQDGDQFPSIPNCEWELIRDLGSYDSDSQYANGEFWNIIQKSQRTGWVQMKCPWGYEKTAVREDLDGSVSYYLGATANTSDGRVSLPSDLVDKVVWDS